MTAPSSSVVTRPRIGRPFQEASGLDLERVTDFISGYHGVRPLPADAATPRRKTHRSRGSRPCGASDVTGNADSRRSVCASGSNPIRGSGPEWPTRGEAMVLFTVTDCSQPDEVTRFASAAAQALVALRGDVVSAWVADIVADVADRCRLNDGQHDRLSAFVQWLMVDSRGTRRLAGRVRALSDAHRTELVVLVSHEVLANPTGTVSLGRFAGHEGRAWPRLHGYVGRPDSHAAG